MDDRRREPRRKTDMILNAYQDGLPTIVSCDNVSISGMRFKRLLGPRRQRPKHIDLEFQLPNDPSVLYIRGEPVYERNDGHVVGVRFLGLNSNQEARVRAYVEGTQKVQHISNAFQA